MTFFKLYHMIERNGKNFVKNRKTAGHPAVFLLQSAKISVGYEIKNLFIGELLCNAELQIRKEITKSCSNDLMACVIGM